MPSTFAGWRNTIGLSLAAYRGLVTTIIGQFLFAGRGCPRCGLTTRHCARLVNERIASIGLDPLITARIRCGEQRRRCSTAAPVTCVRFNSCWATRKSRAPSLPGHRYRRRD